MIGSVEARAVLEGARWLSGALELRGRVDLVDRVDGRRLELRHRTDRWLLVMQRASNEPRLEIDVTDEIDRLGVSATARSRETALEWQISGRGGRRSLRHHGDADETPPAVVPIGDRFTVEIDPMAVQGVRARLDPGDWDIFLRLSWPGISVIGPLTEAEAPGPAPGPVLVGDPGQLVVPVLDDGLRMVVGAPATILAAANRGHPLRTLRTGRQLSILLTAVTSYRATPMTVAIVVRAGADDRPLVGTLRPWLGVAVLDVESSAALADLDPGPHPLVLRSGSEGALTEATLCEVTVDLLGGLGLAGARPVRFGELWLLRYRFVVSRSHGAERSAMKRVRRVLRPLVRRLRGR